MATKKHTDASDPCALQRCIIRAAGYPGSAFTDRNLGGEQFRRWLNDNSLRQMLDFFDHALAGMADGVTTAGKLRRLHVRGATCSFRDEILSLVAVRQRRKRQSTAIVLRWARPAFFVRSGRLWSPISPTSRRARLNRSALFVEWKRVSRRVSPGEGLTLTSDDLQAIGLMLCAALDELHEGRTGAVVVAEVRRVVQRDRVVRPEFRAQTAP